MYINNIYYDYGNCIDVDDFLLMNLIPGSIRWVGYDKNNIIVVCINISPT